MSGTDASLIIAFEHRMLRESLGRSLDLTAGLHVSAMVRDRDALITATRHVSPTLAVVEHPLQGEQVVETVGEIYSRFSVRSVLVCARNAEGLELGLRTPGVANVVFLDEDFSTLTTVIRRALDGESSFGTKKRHEEPTVSRTIPLTRRERTVVELVLQGLTSPDIARELGVSERTVNNHRGNSMRKLNVHNTAELATYVLRHGLVSPQEDAATRVEEKKAAKMSSSTY